MVDMLVHGEHAGAVGVRRECRMRSFWRHEQMAIQMVLTSVQHHSHGAPRSWNTATTARRGGESPRDEVHGQVPDDSPSPGVSSTCTMRKTPRGAAVAGIASAAHCAAHRRHLAVRARFSMWPVPQMGTQVVEVLQKIDTPSVEQVVVVPKISLDPMSSAEGRTVGGSAHDRVLLFYTAADCRADHRHSCSRSWWWWWTRRSSRFTLRTEFSTACGAER